MLRVQDPVFFDPWICGSGITFSGSRISDFVTQIQPISLVNLYKNFGLKILTFSSDKNPFLYLFQNLNNFKVCEIYAFKKGEKTY